MAPSSRMVYARAWRLFQQCLELLGEVPISVNSLPLAPNIILFFIGYLSLRGFASASITTYVSAIGYVHKIKSVHDPTSCHLVQKVLAAISKVSPSSDTRLPITLLILQQLVDALPTVVSNRYNMVMLQAMFVLAFFGLMRIGEFTGAANSKSQLSLDQVKIHLDHVAIKITHFKHNTSFKPFDLMLPIQSNPAICPVRTLSLYLSLRKGGKGPLFIFADGESVPRQFFTTRLQACINFIGLNSRLYKSHSFRIGAASMYASLGMSDSQLRILGRWKSDAFKRYIRCQRLHTSSQ